MTKRAKSPTTPSVADHEPSANLPKVGGADARHPFRRNPPTFAARWFDWLRAQAAIVDPNRPDDDEAVDLLHAAAERAELMIIGTPAATGRQLMQKLALLEARLHENAEIDGNGDSWALLIVASLRGDLLQHLEDAPADSNGGLPR